MKKGFIRVPNDLYTKNYDDIILRVFAEFRPEHIEFRWWESVGVWYLFGISESFDVLRDGQLTPEYDVTITEYDVKFKRVFDAWPK